MGILEGKTAVITGGNSGIGLSAATLFADEGANVVITGRRSDAVREAVRQIGARAVGIVGDVADPEHHKQVARDVKERFGTADIYLANAGIININSTLQVTPAEFDSQFSVNARGAFFGVQSILPVLRDGGSIILTSSIASEKVLEGHAVYAGTKAAIDSFARGWALEFKDRRIRVNILSPGPTQTAIVDKLGLPPEQKGPMLEAMASTIPLGRLGRAEDLAKAALFLASDQSEFVTGVNLRVDGGMGII
jgi:NAD(P)-dependent dehydrogenase (short-subunit alcohol dehydrogenase family)